MMPSSRQKRQQAASLVLERVTDRVLEGMVPLLAGFVSFAAGGDDHGRFLGLCLIADAVGGGVVSHLCFAKERRRMRGQTGLEASNYAVGAVHQRHGPTARAERVAFVPLTDRGGNAVPQSTKRSTARQSGRELQFQCATANFSLLAPSAQHLDGYRFQLVVAQGNNSRQNAAFCLGVEPRQ